MIVALSLVLLPLQMSQAETAVAADVAHCLQHEDATADQNTHHDRVALNHCCAPHLCHATHAYLLNDANGSFSLSPVIVLRLSPYNKAAIVSRPLTPPFHPPKA